MTETEDTTSINRHNLIRLAAGVARLCDDLFGDGPLSGRDPVLRSAGAALQRAVAELRDPVSPEHI